MRQLSVFIGHTVAQIFHSRAGRVVPRVIGIVGIPFVLLGCGVWRIWRRAGAWYDQQAKRYPIMQRLWFRLTLITIATAIVLSPIYAVITQYVNDQSYKLTAKETALLGRSTVDAKFIKETTDAITYNRADEQPEAKGVEQAITLAASKTDATGKQPYQAELSKDPKKGITFSDGAAERSMTLLPKFSTLGAKLASDRVVYPNGSAERHIYTFKANGIKSDIVLTEAPRDDTKVYQWQLKLDKSLEARLNADGSVGVYSADTLLYGDVQVGDEKSQKLIDKARQNGAKNTLAFELPRPFILDANNQTRYDDVAYTLKGDVLSLTVRNLGRQAYPLSIDPTITVTTTADFAQNTGDTGNTDPATADEIRRSLAASGAFGATAAQAAIFTTARSQHTSVVYNNYLYVIGGHDGTNYVSDVRYCSFGANGAIGTCTATTALGTARRGHSSVVSNGYLYVIGGYHATSDTACNGTASNYCSDVRYALICTGSNSGVGGCGVTAGTIGTWSASTSLAVAREGHTSVVYNGYLYVSGGIHATSDTACNGTASTYCSDNLYAPIRANGTIGSWSATTSFTTARTRHTSVVYNGYLYIIGGWNGTTYYNDVQYCTLTSTGTISGCASQAAAFTTTRYGHSSVVYNGYVYIIGGTSGSYQNDIQYCPINTNGSLGSCTQQPAAFTTARAGHTSIAYKGYLYVVGGTNGTNQNDIQHLQVSPTVPQARQQTTAIPSARYWTSTVAYDGYMYVVGAGLSGSNTISKCVINAGGSIGTCSSAGTLLRTLYGAGVSIYHRTIYVSGGYDVTNSNVLDEVSYCNIDQSTHNVSCTKLGLMIDGGNGDRRWLGSVVYNSSLYLIGGSSDSGSYYNDIQSCLIDEFTGIPDVCSTAGTFTTARDELTTVTYGGYLYIIGGKDGAGRKNDIQSCPINSDTSIGTCTAKTTFTNARSGHNAVVHNDKLYITGGWNGTTYYDDIMYCTLGSAGAVSGCTQQTTAFPTARYGHASVMYNGFLYIVGGKGLSASLDDILYMQLGASHDGVDAGGTGTFTTTRGEHTTVAYDGYLYITGGWNGTTVYGDNQYCQLTANGNVGTCTTTTALNTARKHHSAVAYNGYLYAVNGLSAADSNINGIEYCAINSTTHAITSCTSQNTIFSTGRNNHASISYNGRLYVTGGVTANIYHRDIEYCPYNVNGSLGTCTAQANVFPSGRSNHSTAVYNGYLYIVGGFDGTNYRNDIIHCPLQGDGSAGTCVQQVDAMPMNRRSMTTTAYNGYMYIFGGYKNDDVDYYKDMQVCEILPNGNIGGCMVSMQMMSINRSGHATALYDGYVYISGGSDAGSLYFNSIESFSLSKSMPMTARYERYVNMGSGGNTINSFTINGTAPCNYTVSYKTAGADGILGTETVLTGVVAGETQTLGITDKQYVFIVATLDDKGCGFQSTVTSIVIDYIFPLPPNAPTLTQPTNSATGQSVTPEFRLGVTGDLTGNLRYKIEVCSTSDCSSVVRTIDQSVSAVGWTSIGVVVDKYIESHVYQAAALNPGTQYWWRAQAKDPLNANLWSTNSSIFSFTTAAVTSAPTLSMPSNAATGVNIRPEFRLGVTGNVTGNLKYKIEVCSVSNCLSLVRTIDEMADETGWTAIGDVGGTFIMGHTYLPVALSPSTQYWWRAQAKDPGGANQWSAYSSTFSFTTGVVNLPGQIIVNSGSTIYGGSNLKTGN